MASKDELACVYSALILQDDDVAITPEKIHTILKASKVEVESYWPTLFAKALESIDVKSLITNLGSAASVDSSSAIAPTLDPVPAAVEKKEEKKQEEPKEESDDDMGFGLFD